MNLKRRPLLGRVVETEPPEDIDVREPVESEQARLVLFVQDDERAAICFFDEVFEVA